MWSSAIKDAVEKIRKNMDTFGTRFPHVSRDGAYLLNDNDDWTNGFWSGLSGYVMNTRATRPFNWARNER